MASLFDRILQNVQFEQSPQENTTQAETVQVLTPQQKVMAKFLTSGGDFKNFFDSLNKKQLQGVKNFLHEQAHHDGHAPTVNLTKLQFPTMPLQWAQEQSQQGNGLVQGLLQRQNQSQGGGLTDLMQKKEEQ